MLTLLITTMIFGIIFIIPAILLDVVGTLKLHKACKDNNGENKIKADKYIQVSMVLFALFWSTWIPFITCLMMQLF